MSEETTATQQSTENNHDSENVAPPLWRTLVDTLWFPLFFVCGFIFCYLLAFHSPSPHNVKVAIADPATAAQIEATMAKKAPGTVDVTPVGSAEQARQSVLDRNTVAGFSADPAKPTLFVAKADGYMLESVLGQMFGPVAASTGHQLTTVDVAPTASGDKMGTGLFYLILAWTIPSYIVVMMLLRAVSLRRRDKLIVLAAWSVFLTVFGYYGALSMDVIPNDPVAMPIALLLTLGISLTAFGLVPLTKQFFPGIAVGLFIFLSMPSSGGAIPIQMVPGFFRALHPIMPMGNLIEALRGVFYFNGVGITRPILVLAGWLLVGLLLIGGYTIWARTRHARLQTDVQEPPVEDPSFEMPRPTAVPAGERSFGRPEPTLRGLVHGPDGTPVTAATVTATGARGEQLVRTTTDADGRFALAGLPDQLVTLVVNGRGYAPEARRLRIEEGRCLAEDFQLAKN